MLKTIARIWNRLFAPKDWQPYGDAKAGTFRARRWTGDAWEYRELTDAEVKDAAYWQANSI